MDKFKLNIKLRMSNTEFRNPNNGTASEFYDTPLLVNNAQGISNFQFRISNFEIRLGSACLCCRNTLHKDLNELIAFIIKILNFF